MLLLRPFGTLYYSPRIDRGSSIPAIVLRWGYTLAPLATRGVDEDLLNSPG